MPIIIGGPPSSGSSLLSVILNRHSKVSCIQETHLLTKPSLYLNWDAEKSKIKKGRLHSPGWHQYSKIDLPSDYKIELTKMINAGKSVSDFAETYFSHIAKSENKIIWAEKTPANVYFFQKLNDLLDRPVFILTIRHPYDIIASLIQRGKPIIDAVALCLLNMGIGYLHTKALNLHTVKYESLIQSPNTYLKDLCSQLNIEFEESMIKYENEPSVKMKGWKLYEDGPIKNSSINRFTELSSEQQDRILHYCKYILINPEHLNKYGIHSDCELNINMLISHFGYKKEENNSAKSIKPNLIKDRLIRVIKLHPSSKPYPIMYKNL